MGWQKYRARSQPNRVELKIGYLLYDETCSGVIESQALDIVRFFNNETEHNAVLVAALPFRSHRTVKQQFEDSLGKSVVSTIALPQKLQVKLHKFEVKRIQRMLKRAKVDLIICRNASACFLALQARILSGQNTPRICYDGRGALKAEAAEYRVYPKYIKPHLIRAEKTSILKSDFRIAVSEELVDWWKSEYGFASDKHCVIPTTISTLHQNFNPTESRKEWRGKFNFKQDDIVMAFAGGKADWQGLDFWLPHMYTWLSKMPRLKLLLLTPANPSVKTLCDAFPSRVLNTFVVHNDVLKALSSSDFGILWRKPNITNIVASPTKLSEYVQAGLTVVTNDGTAVARVVASNKLGIRLNPEFHPEYPAQLEMAQQERKTMDFSKKQFYCQLPNFVQ